MFRRTKIARLLLHRHSTDDSRSGHDPARTPASVPRLRSRARRRRLVLLCRVATSRHVHRRARGARGRARRVSTRCGQHRQQLRREAAGKLKGRRASGGTPGSRSQRDLLGVHRSGYRPAFERTLHIFCCLPTFALRRTGSGERSSIGCHARLFRRGGNGLPVMLDCRHPAGWHPLLVLTVEDTLAQAREEIADHPDLPRLVADGCARVADKWNPTTMSCGKRDVGRSVSPRPRPRMRASRSLRLMTSTIPTSDRRRG